MWQSHGCNGGRTCLSLCCLELEIRRYTRGLDDPCVHRAALAASGPGYNDKCIEHAGSEIVHSVFLDYLVVG